jgi:hypothetical protein
VRPTAFVDEWPEKDRLLAEALTHYEESAHCPGCGQLKSKAWDEDSAGSWGAENTITCHACAAQQEKQKERGTKDAKPGELRFVTLDEKSLKIAKARKKAQGNQ